MMLGVPRDLAYTLNDMAADAVGVLDHLGVDGAHVIGYSMGGMIAQTMAIDHPERVLSLTSMMSRTGSRLDAFPGVRELAALMRTRPTDSLDSYLSGMETLAAVIGSPDFPTNKDRLRQIASIAYERGIHLDGTARQLHAINCQPKRDRAPVPTRHPGGGAPRLGGQARPAPRRTGHCPGHPRSRAEDLRGNGPRHPRAALAPVRRRDRNRRRPRAEQLAPRPRSSGFLIRPTPCGTDRPMSNPGTPENPLRVAIIGAGPSGFYAADQIIKDPETHAQVDLFDRLPTPYGLVRGGVAPDHPKIKSVTRVYERTAAKEGFRFFGNVEVGRDLDVEDFEKHYHAVIYTFGAEADRELGIPGEDLPGSYAATAFVGWYNAHPDYADRDFNLDEAKRAVVIGNGNVAMDVARMLALDDAELRKTDTADHAIDVLDASHGSRRSSCSAAAAPPRPPTPTRRSRNSASSKKPT